MISAFVVYVLASLGVIVWLTKQLQAKDERAERERSRLEDRIMALTDREALTQVMVARDEAEPAKVSYIDEERGTRTSRTRESADASA